MSTHGISFEELKAEVIKIANNWDLYNNSDRKSQALKFFAEAGELADDLNKGNTNACIDHFGDVLVTLINMAEFMGLNLESCLAAAVVEISQRRGLMLNGVFVKYDDLPDDLKAKVDAEQPAPPQQLELDLIEGEPVGI